MVHGNNQRNSNDVVTEQTTVTTTTSAMNNQVQGNTTHVAPAVVEARVVERDAIINTIQDAAVVDNIIEKKNVEVHQKQVVQEIHEQPIIEIEKQRLVQHVQEAAAAVQTTKQPVVYEEVGVRELSSEHRAHLDSLTRAGETVVDRQQSVQNVHHGETVVERVIQPIIERHQQAHITEVREQTVVQEVIQPVVRKIHEAPIIREVGSTTLVQNVNVAPVATTTTTNVTEQSSSTHHHHTGVHNVDGHNTAVVAPNTGLVGNNTGLVGNNTGLVGNNTGLVGNNTTGMNTVTTTSTTGHHHGTTGHHNTTGTNTTGEPVEKRSIGDKIKSALHIGQNKNDDTTNTKY